MGVAEIVRERGSVLVFTLMTLAVLMLVGVAFTSMATVEYRTAANHTAGIQAFYIAEAGINWARQALRQQTISLPSGFSVGQEHVVYRSAAFPGTGTPDTLLSDVGEMRVSFVRTAAGWDLVSQGIVGQAHRTLTMQVTVVAGSGAPPPEMVVTGSVQLSGGATVHGDLVAADLHIEGGAQADGNVRILGDSAAGKITVPRHGQMSDFVTGSVGTVTTLGAFNFPSLTAPSVTPARGDFIAGWNPSPPRTLPGTGGYSNINVESTLRIHVPDNNDVLIRTGALRVTGSGGVQISGSGQGRVIIHVDTTLEIRGGATINEDGDSNRLDIYYYGSTHISIPGGTHVNASIVIASQTASLSIEGSGEVNGHILTRGPSVSISGSGQHTGVLYAPNAQVQLTGSAQQRGVVISRTVLGAGSADYYIDTGVIGSSARFTTQHTYWPGQPTYTFQNWGSR